MLRFTRSDCFIYCYSDTLKKLEHAEDWHRILVRRNSYNSNLSFSLFSEIRKYFQGAMCLFISVFEKRSSFAVSNNNVLIDYFLTDKQGKYCILADMD